jgi:hypothetical protein
MSERTRDDVLRELAYVRESIPHYFGGGPSGDMAQDCFEREFDGLLDREEELVRELAAFTDGDSHV